jgi:predicted nucleic acid-binding protein
VTIVVDASVVAAGLIGTPAEILWATSLLSSDDLIAPHLLPAEVGSILRFAALGGALSVDDWSSAQEHVSHLSVELFPYAPFGQRVWELRQNVTTYDGWYVALAEALDAPLATLDGKLMQAPGPRCRFVTLDDAV